MNRIPGATLAVLAAVGAMAQGTVNFSNVGFDGVVGVNAPIFDIDGTTKLGAGFVAQLWAGPTANSLTAVSGTIGFSTSSPGYFFGGSTAIPTVPAGSPAFYQVRVWNAGAGATWGEAYAAALAGAPSTRIGFNNPNYANPFGPAASILQTPPLGGDATSAANLVGLTSFHLWPIPEPSVLALGALAGLGLLIRRRR